MAFPVFLIHSNYSIPDLDDFFSKYGTVGYLRMVYDNNGAETDRTIAILGEDVYNTLCANGYNNRNNLGVKISRFTLNDSHFPPEKKNTALFIPVPVQFRTTHQKMVRGTINRKLEHLAQWGIIPADSWSIASPVVSRETGELKNGCFVSFNNVLLENIAMARVILTDCYWNDTPEKLVFKCFWARDREQKPQQPQPQKLQPREILKRGTFKKEILKESSKEFLKKEFPKRDFKKPLQLTIASGDPPVQNVNTENTST